MVKTLYVNVSTICICHNACSSILNISCSAIAKASFVDYIKGGCELNLIVAIDFTVRSDVVSIVCKYCVCTYIGLQW